MMPLICKEHEAVEGFREKLEAIGTNPFDLKLNPDDPNRILGLGYDCMAQRFFAHYYIGTAWIDEKEEIALAVLPKVNLDFPRMFMSCWDDMDDEIQNKLSEIYHIDLDAKPISVPGMDVEIMPLIILHFVKLVENLLKHGLKSDYVIREENLQGKIKGKLLFSQQVKHNIFHKRQDLNYCRFQEYSVDCIENRIIKRALHFSKLFLEGHRFSSHEKVQTLIYRELEAFGSVSEEVSISQLKTFRVNLIYREYAQALKVAKIILRRYSYDISKVEYDNQEHLMQPFWINMPLLFELYVLQKLKHRYGELIKYHISTNGNEIDFGKTDEKLILDAKYIPSWDEKVIHENVRQLCGYARHKTIRRKLLGYEDSTTILPCMILYADINNGVSEFSEDKLLTEKNDELPMYLNFYKLGIGLPVK